MSIVFVISSLKNCGPVTILCLLARQFVKTGARVTIVTLSPSPADNREADLASLGCEIIELGAKHGISGAIQVFFSLRRLIRGLSAPTIVHSHGLRSDFLLSVIGHPDCCKTVSTLHNCPEEDYGFCYGRFKGRLMARIHFWSLAHFNAVVAVSKSVYRKTLNRSSNGLWISNGMDSTHFFPEISAAEQARLDRQAGWQEGAVRFIVSSVLTNRKNIDFILQTFGSVTEIPFHLIVLGSGPEESRFRETFRDDPRIELRGFQKEVLPFLQTADVYISASKSEGMPCSVLEAVLCGTPVLLSDIPPHREILENVPVAGTLFDLNSQESFRQAVLNAQRISPDRRLRIARAAGEKYAAEIMATQYMELYMELESDPDRAADGNPPENGPERKASFSVLMSVYHQDVPSQLRTALESIWDRQTRKPAEIVIVKDGPLNGELDSLIDAFAEKAPVRIVPLKQNMGLGNALRHGLSACSNEIVARMDSDDIAVPDRFEKQIGLLERKTDIALCGGMIEEFSGEPSNITGFRILPLGQQEIRKFSKWRNPFNHMTVAFRKPAILEAGSYEHLPGYEDYWLWARVIAGGGKVINLPDVLVHARAGEDMLKRRRGWTLFRAEIDLAKKLRRIGLLSYSEMIRNICLKGVIRIMPLFVLKKVYAKLRKNR